jgi:magnesium chelatase subunit I
MAIPFPFSAIVGQNDMKIAIQIVAVDPSVNGILALGDRGTGKSTAVRALADLLPAIKVVKNCSYGCDPKDLSKTCEQCEKLKLSTTTPPSELRPVPVVDLPLGASEDRVVGALDLEKALSQGIKSFSPGLLAKANRGFLYIDEVNLLEDHLVDLLIDVAASGENLVEREGLSVRHPARFVLVGSGNPEEGELRPQLLDRFGLCVEVKTPQELEERILVIKRRDAFEKNPEKFQEEWREANEALREKITKAKKRLDKVILMTIFSVCAQNYAWLLEQMV